MPIGLQSNGWHLRAGLQRGKDGRLYRQVCFESGEWLWVFVISETAGAGMLANTPMVADHALGEVVRFRVDVDGRSYEEP